MDKKLTIGMATHDDFDGVYFTCNSIRLNAWDRLDEIDLVVIDNNPDSKQGKATKLFCRTANIRYIEEREQISTACRNKIFENVEAAVAMCIDSHVLIEKETVYSLLDRAENLADDKNLYHGVMLYDYLDSNSTPVTHMDPIWNDNMFGVWAHDERGCNKENAPFPIPMHGMGLFLSSVKHFQGFHKLFKGFGGEEGYIHEKTRQAGGDIICLPWLRWMHRFQRPNETSYANILQDRIVNYFIGFSEVGWNTKAVINHFKIANPDIEYTELLEHTKEMIMDYHHYPEETLKKRFDPSYKTITWNDTLVELKDPLELEIKGNKILVSKFSFNWSSG